MVKSDRETVPQTWSSDSEGAIDETSASALNDTRARVPPFDVIQGHRN